MPEGLLVEARGRCWDEGRWKSELEELMVLVEPVGTAAVCRYWSRDDTSPREREGDGGSLDPAVRMLR